MGQTLQSGDLYNLDAESILISKEDWKMRKYVFCTVALICMLVFASGTQAATIMINPATLESPTAGGTITVSVEVQDMTDLFAYQFDLVFDNAAVKFSGIQEENFLGADGTITFAFLSFDGQLATFEDITPDVVLDVNSDGKISLANTRLGSIAGVAGAGKLVTIIFEVLEARASTLELQSVALADTDAQPIAADVVSGVITDDVHEELPPVVREHSPGSLILALEATYDEANMHGYTYIDVWKGSIPIKTGMFLEFQVAMFSGNPVFSGSVDLHTGDGSALRDSGASDQNEAGAHPATDLSEYARDKWYHRTIPLDALAGKELDGVMIGTASDEHDAGMFRVYIDNIQITDGEHILKSIYIDEGTVPITGADTSTETAFAGTEGMSSYSVTVVGATPVAPAAKLISQWGNIKSRQ